jgi:hypothetical protein
MAVTVVVTGNASVETVKVPPVLDVQKPPRQVGKRFQDCLEVAPLGKE